MIAACDMINFIKNHENTEEIIKTISSDFEYYNSLLSYCELTINQKKIVTGTTFLGLAALYADNELIKGLLKLGVPADGFDIFLYRRSLFEVSNYRLPDWQGVQYMPFYQNDDCWSTITRVFNSCGELLISIPWSTPVILAILSENAEGLQLLLEHGACCDLRYNFFADALSLCEDEALMNTLQRFRYTHIKETTADVLTVFNVTLAKFLYKLGIKPDDNIIHSIKMKYISSSNMCFPGDYYIDANSKLWEDYYQQRADECIEFYSSKGLK